DCTTYEGVVFLVFLFFFFFQAEDGIRDSSVTGVQTCALPISKGRDRVLAAAAGGEQGEGETARQDERGRIGLGHHRHLAGRPDRSEERRVGKECRSRGSTDA